MTSENETNLDEEHGPLLHGSALFHQTFSDSGWSTKHMRCVTVFAFRVTMCHRLLQELLVLVSKLDSLTSFHNLSPCHSARVAFTKHLRCGEAALATDVTFFSYHVALSDIDPIDPLLS